MSLLDVDDVILDPYVGGEPFTVLRRLETVGEDGRVVLATQKLRMIGHISPTAPNSLVRETAYQMQRSSITVITTYPLMGPARDNGSRWQPDVVLWHTSFYVVAEVNDWSNWGRGFIEAHCTSMQSIESEPNLGGEYLGRLNFSSASSSAWAAWTVEWRRRAGRK
jgi:hypothetical protein